MVKGVENLKVFSSNDILLTLWYYGITQQATFNYL